MSEMKEIICLLGELKLSTMSPREALQEGYDLGQNAHSDVPHVQKIIDACELLSDEAETVEEEMFWDDMAASALRGFRAGNIHNAALSDSSDQRMVDQNSNGEKS